LVLSAGGAAERAGVPPGARLLEVNGASVEKLTYNQLNRKVGLPAVTPYMNSPSLPSSFPSSLHEACPHSGSPGGARCLPFCPTQMSHAYILALPSQLWQSGDQVTLLVAGLEVEEQCHQLGMPLAAPLAEGWALPAKPRCLNIEKGPEGFGFLLREEKGLDGRLGEWQLWGLVGSWTIGWPYTFNCASQHP
jgi:hypothetical protein